MIITKSNWEALNRGDDESRWIGRRLWCVSAGKFIRITGTDRMGNLMINGKAAWVGFDHIRNSITVVDVTGWRIRKITQMVKEQQRHVKEAQVKMQMDYVYN